jgi:hypothetical protein
MITKVSVFLRNDGRNPLYDSMLKGRGDLGEKPDLLISKRRYKGQT